MLARRVFPGVHCTATHHTALFAELPTIDTLQQVPRQVVQRVPPYTGLQQRFRVHSGALPWNQQSKHTASEAKV